MPIYEFYCKQCNTIYKFLSRSINTEKVPSCPRCSGASLRRVPSLFALGGKRKGEGPADADMPDIDETKLEKAMSMLASEAGQVNEDDPRQAARLMRRLTDATGISLGPGIEEMMSRMERGEDPEKIEQEMGDLLENEDPFVAGSGGRAARKRQMPHVDETLYEL